MKMILDDESTWPAELVACLKKHQGILYSWEVGQTGLSTSSDPAHEYDHAHSELRTIADAFSLKGYHCTKLTEGEIRIIKKEGMRLQNLTTLSSRVNLLVDEGLMNFDIASRLKTENQANDNNRAGMLWFCFFPPKIAGEGGIERFFRSWGGEALYNSHENNLETGSVLKAIGIPCIVEADVSIVSLSKHCFLTDKLARVYLKNRGLKTGESCELEAYAVTDIPAESINQIIQHPSEEFIALTSCDKWSKLLKD